MEDNESAHGLPSSLSAVFDSSDDDDLLNTQATQTALYKDHSANGLQCTAQDVQDDLLCSQVLRLSDEYSQAGEQLQEQLSCLGLSTTQLSPAAACDLQCIAAAAQALRLQGCQNSAILLALSQLRIQESQLACAQHESQELATWLAHKQNSAVRQLKKMRLALDSAQSNGITDQTNGYHHNIAMLAQKEQQYTRQLQILEEKLASVQYSPLLRHTALMQRQMQYEQQAKEVVAKEARLARYLDLPPDMTAAKSVYEQKLQSLMSARKQLEDGLARL
ncbi:hypothetical protein WJX77_006789 [Trebouxia sp. C0004]